MKQKKCVSWGRKWFFVGPKARRGFNTPCDLHRADLLCVIPEEGFTLLVNKYLDRHGELLIASVWCG
ncbi:MAG: hypothetical protein EAZ79_01535 [Oscillatoriales cyanobacterium]|nr:MAG: hypothetical protein EAZ79_01535 [Oscillatoriales cyanobacterium]